MISINKSPDKPRGMRQLYALGKKRKFDLSLSENPLGCSPKVGKFLGNSFSNFSDYPEPNGLRLKRALAQSLNCGVENIFVANGSEAIISDIPKVFVNPGDEVLIPALTFPMFRICSELAGLSVILVPMTPTLEIDLEAISKQVTAKTKLIFVCNPNNPVGSVIAKEKILTFLEKIPASAMVVIDEASIGFGGESVIEQVLRLGFDNVLILRTFSKAFGLADLRLGFAVGSKKLVSKLEEEKPVFPVSGLSERVGIAALSDLGFIDRTKKFVDRERKKISIGLEALGFTVFPSQSNNLFVRLPANRSPQQFSQFLDAEDVSLVMGSNFPGFDDRYFRVSIRQKSLNDIFLQVVSKFINEVQ